jgi:hypothetical protein
VLRQPRQVAEPEIDDLDSLTLDKAKNLGRRALFHRMFLPFP